MQQYVLRLISYTVPTRDLNNSIKPKFFWKRIKLDNMVSAKVFLHPNVVRGEGVSSREAELQLVMEIKRGLFSDILSKMKTCYIQVVTRVKEKGTDGDVLATHEDNIFRLVDCATANYVCKLISAEELSKCKTRSVEISIETILSVEEWQNFSVKLEGEYVLITV